MPLLSFTVAGAALRMESPPHEQPAGLDIRTAQDPETFVMALHGDLDVAGAGKLRAAMRRATASGAPTVVIDLGSLKLIDSAGMRALLELDERLERSGRRPLLLPGPQNVQYALHVCGLLQILTFTDA